MERRVVWAILLMMAIAIVPAIFIKKPPKANGRAGVPAGSSDSAAAGAAPQPRGDWLPPRPPPPAPQPTAPEDTALVSSPVYTYGVSTQGGRFVKAVLTKYRTMAPGQSG